MGYIKILDESVSNIIAAGEVVENPASMIKEMIENSLDAKATVIKIEVFKGGTEVKINDNGIGMDKEDTLLSIERHATSKISTKDDVFNLQTYGFRGEALASIAAVSKLTITTRTAASNTGYRIGSYGGVVRKFEEISRNPGTEIEVRDLFYNTPARKKFLRKESTEYNKIRDIVLKEALANTEVAFILELDGKATINTSGRGIDNTILELFGKSVLRNLNKFEYGYLGNVEILRSSKDYIFTYINKRYVKSATIERAVIDGYYTKLMKGKYPFAIIFFDIDPAEIDVNVHPSKKIVKFSNDKAIYRQLKDSIDEFFYHNDRENWQPNIDLLKQNINVENKDEKISNLFSDEIVKTDSQKFFSFETHDGNFDVVNSDANKEENVMVETETERNYSAEESQDVNPEVAKKEAASKEIMSVNEENVDFSVSYNEKENEKQDSVIPEVRGEYFQKAEKEERYANFNIEKSSEGYKVGTFEKHEGRQFDYNILGQIFDTYILVRKNDELEIYDQHIIHERILYEELKDKFYSKKLDSQQLLIPQKIEVTAVEKSIILENQETFSEFGFDIDQFSDNEMLLRAVPAFDFREDVKNVFHKLLEDLKDENEIKDLRENIIISMSCKGAVKAGQKLDMGEMQNMVRRLHEVGKYTCPHGRPIIVKLTKNDLDKMFGRKK
ncbi:DNA mismatch repair protein [Leptotrichia sp. oral taxon 215 str. W9775]|uniref:DNA mismatch repair endonuclease MutL n=1 Tax=Leptotrichia sp. oral taxon 215 TaxID=712359 RepID=UPI0003ADFEF7|nr:DNA mismatch repair endonuclease MutL [Leptotrichia sp. oral taxon 215]ERK67530.1 DNA mismatch repair protein [Leptotrichia sp. oral taxon 215 str. W9775]